MKKVFMILVCLMITANVNAQKYHPTVVAAYENWLVYNDGKTIEDFINVKYKWLVKHYGCFVSPYGSTAEVGSYARNKYEENLKMHKKACEEYAQNPTTNALYTYNEASHSSMYGHFECACLHEDGCSHSINRFNIGVHMDETKYDRAKEHYETFYNDCLICEYEKMMLGHEYGKLLKKRYKNWINSDKYKELQDKEKNRRITSKKMMKYIRETEKDNYNEIMKLMKR